MDNDDVKTARQYAEDAKQAAREAADSARNFAQASVDAAASIRQGISDGARTYARDAVNATGRRIGVEHDRLEAMRRLGERYVSDQPVRAALVAAVGGALLTAIFIALLNGGRR
jgi:hypothetical protein